MVNIIKKNRQTKLSGVLIWAFNSRNKNSSRVTFFLGAPWSARLDVQVVSTTGSHGTIQLLADEGCEVISS